MTFLVFSVTIDTIYTSFSHRHSRCRLRLPRSHVPVATQHPAQRHQGHGDQPHDLGEPADVLTRLRGPAQERAPGAPAAVGAGGPRPGRPRGQGRQRSQPDGEGEELGEEDGDARRDPHHGQQATVFVS